MLVVLINEAGEKMCETFDNLHDAAQWCAQFPEYGITLHPKENEEWNDSEWLETLYFYFS